MIEASAIVPWGAISPRADVLECGENNAPLNRICPKTAPNAGENKTLYYES